MFHVPEVSRKSKLHVGGASKRCLLASWPLLLAQNEATYILTALRLRSEQAKFAKQSGIEIIPVIMEGGGWTASGWLGLLTAGALWTPLFDESNFESNIRKLHGQIELVLRQTSADDFDEIGSDCVAATFDEATEELGRLRENLTKTPQSFAKIIAADASDLAIIPAGVPKLPVQFQSTEKIQELTRLVLSTSAADMSMPRVGFFGMGGTLILCMPFLLLMVS